MRVRSEDDVAKSAWGLCEVLIIFPADIEQDKSEVRCNLSFPDFHVALSSIPSLCDISAQFSCPRLFR